MPNETKTVNFVRDFLRKGNYLKIEEQSSDNPRIQKLLKGASKKGTGSGRPDFIVTPNEKSWIIVIECKADEKHHVSDTKDNYHDYAVDGVLLYADYLSKEYDVIAISVSGEEERYARISHHLKLKGTDEFIDLDIDKLRTWDALHEMFIDHNEVKRRDYSELLICFKSLNDKLHGYGVKEDKRSLFVSGVLIALQDDSFKYDKLEGLASREKLYNTIESRVKELSKGEIAEEFSFLKRVDDFKDSDKIRELITIIDENINSYIKTRKYYDVLSDGYLEFLRYSNSDKGLGIVLTPPHITELFTELAGVNKNSTLWDNCCGTGGFLVAAMRKMIDDANGEKQKEKHIKSKQLIGVEKEATIYALSTCNMLLHGDGKSGIKQGNCFDKQYEGIDIGLLNPPYRSDKKEDTHEWKFVLNNLDALKEGGKCIALLPMQCVIGSENSTKKYKARLLENHTLDGVISLPDQLFHDSKVSVVTCAVIITAHVKHQEYKSVWFAYGKDDGFEVKKHKGRTEKESGSWQATKDKWLEYFMNKKEERGFSIMQSVTAEDEWCAEAYMETDYSELMEEDFEKNLRSYIAHKIQENL